MHLLPLDFSLSEWHVCRGISEDQFYLSISISFSLSAFHFIFIFVWLSGGYLVLVYTASFEVFYTCYLFIFSCYLYNNVIRQFIKNQTVKQSVGRAYKHQNNPYLIRRSEIFNFCNQKNNIFKDKCCMFTINSPSTHFKGVQK